MSKILKQLCEVTEVNQKRGEDEADFKKRLIQAISELNDEDWNSLSAEAQDWFNDAVDAMNAKKDIPAFPDAEKEEPTSRRRSSKDPEPAAAEPKSSRRGAAKEAPADVGVGDKVVVTNKRGKTFEGEIVEMDDEIVVLKEADGEETEIARDRIESMVAAKKEEPKSGRRRAADDDKDPEPAVVEPKEGDEIEAVTARDKTVKGKVVEVADDLVVVDDGDGEIELAPSKLKSLKILGGKTKEEPKSSRRGAAKDKDSADEKKPRTRSTNKEGVSATVRMRELIAEDFDRSRDDVDKLLKKEGLEFRPNTLDLVFADCHKFIKILDAAGKLK